MRYICLKEFRYQDGRANFHTVNPGDIVDLFNRHVVSKLEAGGAITLKSAGAPGGGAAGATGGYALPAAGRGINILYFMHSTPWYSGGRLHIIQQALCMARNGHNATILTDMIPKWFRDYPEHPNLAIREIKRGIPGRGADLAIATPGGSAIFMQGALDYSKRWGVPSAFMVYETPNWIEQFDKKYAAQHKMGHYRTFYEQCDFVIANAEEPRKFFLEWIGRPKATTILPSAINSLAAAGVAPHKHPRPYAVICGRGAFYKGVDTAAKAVHAIPRPYDLYIIGKGRVSPKLARAKDHAVHVAQQIPDAQKFSIIAGADMMIAPSRFEGFGMSVAEGVLMGKPTIVYDLPALRNVFGDRLIYARWNDEADVIAKARAVADAPPPAERLQAAAKWARETVSIEAMERNVRSVPYCFPRNYKAGADVKISACMLLYCNAQTVEAALEAVYPHVHQIIIVYGPVKRWAGFPADGSLELARAFPDPDSKIEIHTRDEWKDKGEMRNHYARRIEGTHQLELDADEIWVGLPAWKEYIARTKHPCAVPIWVNFWRDAEHWVVDPPGWAHRRWGRRVPKENASYCPHYRWSEWKPSYRFETHVRPVYPDKRALWDWRHQHNFHVGAECVIYHFGQALAPDLMTRKFDFYTARDSSDGKRKAQHKLKEHRRRVWDEWKGELGDRGDGLIQRVDWDLPAIVRRASPQPVASLEAAE